MKEVPLLKLFQSGRASYHWNVKLHVLAVAALVCLGLPTVAAAVPSHDASFSNEGLFKADANDLKDTRLVAHPDTPLPADTNVLWCGTMQLVWNKAIDLVGEKLRFTTPSPLAGLLNQEDFTKNDLDPSSYVAIADFERNHVEDEIRAALEKTFHGAASPELIPPTPEHPGPDDFVAYAYLYKNLAFAKPFSDKTTLEFNGQEVKNFGFDADQLDDATRQQVTISDYQSDDDFVIKIATKSANDELILAKIAPGATLQKTVQTVLERAAHGSSPYLDRRDCLAVPKLNFDLRRDFGELEGLILQPTAAAKIKNPLVIAKAEQLVRFQLNEKGAILKSEAAMEMMATAMPAQYEPPTHRLIFNAPFLLLLKQKSASQPYFAVWIGNTTLLIRDTK